MPQTFDNLDAAHGSTQLTDRAIFLAAFRKLFADGLSLTDIREGEWETVAAGQTDKVLGVTGAAADYLYGLLIVPANTSPGAVSIKDGGGSAITVFTGGASSVSNLVPFFVPLGIKSIAGPWKVTTGADVSVIGIGNFTA